MNALVVTGGGAGTLVPAKGGGADAHSAKPTNATRVSVRQCGRWRIHTLLDTVTP